MLDDPPSRQELEAFDAGRTLDNLDGPRAAVGDSIAQLRTAIDAVGKDVAEPREAPAQRAQQQHRAMRVLDVGLMDQRGGEKAFGIGDDVALAPFDTLARRRSPAGRRSRWSEHSGCR